jgi:hypothetical protein
VDMWICLAVIMLKCSVLHDIKSFIPDLSTTISQLSQVIPEVIHRNIHVERWQLLGTATLNGESAYTPMLCDLLLYPGFFRVRLVGLK